jgi:hypothetical protein
MKWPVAVTLAMVGVGPCLGGPPLRPGGTEWPPVIGAWFWKDDTEDGRIRGVLQGGPDAVPAPLLALTPDWHRLGLPPLLPEAPR